MSINLPTIRRNNNVEVVVKNLKDIHGVYGMTRAFDQLLASYRTVIAWNDFAEFPREDEDLKERPYSGYVLFHNQLGNCIHNVCSADISNGAKVTQLKKLYRVTAFVLFIANMQYPTYKESTMKNIKNTIVDFTTTTKEGTVNITAKVVDKATDNVVTSKVHDFRINRLISKIAACTTLEEEMPLRRQLNELKK